MKKIFPLLLVLMILLFGALIFKDHITSHVILLKDGSRIIADESWVVGDKVFYESQGRTEFVPIDRVKDLKQGGFKKGSEIAIFIQKRLDAGRKTASELFNWNKSGTTGGKVRMITWVPVLAGILVCIWISALLLRKRRSSQAEEKGKKPVPANPDKKVTTVPHDNRNVIAEHFLKVFKAQLEAEEDAEALIKAVEPHSPDGNHIYELRVKMGDEWNSRRMTMGRIGEDSGSRSRCYYVIYDDHLVVKVPPFPVTNFKTYQQRLLKEAAIAARIAPRECLVPQISTILKKVRPLRGDAALPAEEQEKKYVKWIEENPDYRQYLQIEGAFAYFMDLSKYFFLKHILDSMHDSVRSISKEIINHPDIIWNGLEFEARYGPASSALSDELQTVYKSFENRVRDYLEQHQPDMAVQNFLIKEWFLIYLSNGRLNAGDMQMKSGSASGLNGIANKLFREKRKPVEAYRKMVTAYVTGKGLTRNKAQISGMITNLLDLLAWLNRKKVAMRDLKPDNLLVAGDPTRFPQFLESAASYTIGLIDVETAVWLGKDRNGKIGQPLLGGTPSFATPTHTLPNQLIQHIYGDLALVLHLQDWYAALGMVYHMVTGKRLFKETAKTLIRLNADIKKGVREKGRSTEWFRQASQRFWLAASREFEQKTDKQVKQLKYISLIISPGARDMLMPVILKTQQHVDKSAKKLILKQTFFTNSKLKKSLYAATYMKVNRFKAKFFSDPATLKLPAEEKQTAFAMLDELESLKKQAEQLALAEKLLIKSMAIISSHDLLHCIFTMVLVNMHQKVWGPAGRD